MKTVGIIVEYNPLHNGHVYHIEETKRLSKADRLVCVMSGNFTQRGEPAIIDKFTRTKWALNNGVDLVIELPFVFTVQNADIFASTSVSILNHLCVDEIYFGSETGDIDELHHLGNILESTEFNMLIKKYSKDGNSYPTSSDLAMKDLYPNNSYDLPNNILGIQYILAGKKLNSKIVFKTIKRISTNYFDEEDKNSTIQSATTIRKLVNNENDIVNYVPKDVYETLTTRKPVGYEDFYLPIRHIFSSSTSEDLHQIFNITEGIENRFLKINSFNNVSEFIHKSLTRRYTNSKIKRALAHILCNVKKHEITSFEIPYIRVLGMNKKGQAFLNEIKHDLEIPLIVKVKEGIHPYLDIEIRVSKVYSIGSDEAIFRGEFMQPIK
ncbi:hypothetical protein KQ51_01684 [Candidatus Izimaplasma bacterium HR1]|jgi:predicted nucleotidyltransferase|uniref:nucleotidyltransferase n=1 Tax=Candidatus Izimoplasma sp. HR1 TaxID=1541959 RepID=UPI0004F8E194|nr:hypothetical protein KQ51_01684 [Candidatus Izimaplasma bacterium HR1]